MDEVIETEAAAQARARAAQARVEQLDDETLRLLTEYRTELARLADLRAYNDNLREMLASQDRERARVAAAQQEIEGVRREIVPLMVEMVEVLERFVALDTPFLPEERTRRISALRDLLGRADVDVAEKFRRIVEAYEIEAEYGQSIEAWGGPLEREGRELTVDYLRIGRVGLFYVTLDRSAAGLFDPKTRTWETLPSAYVEPVDLALRVARKQAPPNLLELPLWTESGP